LAQVGTVGPERAAGPLQPFAQAVTPTVHVLSAAQICDAALPVASPAALAQRESTSPSSLPPAMFDPTHATHAFVAPAGTSARPFFERQNVSAAQFVTVPSRSPFAEHVLKPDWPAYGVPGTPLLFPVQTRVPGTHSAMHAALAPFVAQRPMAHAAAAPHLPVASQVWVATSPPGPPSASEQRIVPGAQSAPQSFALLPLAAV
jgi:hypothetical protein